jgi:hypothetical protein
MEQPTRLKRIRTGEGEVTSASASRGIVIL